MRLLAELQGWGILAEKSLVDFLPTSLGKCPGPPCYYMLGAAWDYLQICSQFTPLPGIPQDLTCNQVIVLGIQSPSGLATTLFYKLDWIASMPLPAPCAPSPLNDSFFPTQVLTLPHTVLLLPPIVFQNASSFLPPCAQILHILSDIMPMSPLHKAMPHPSPAQSYSSSSELCSFFMTNLSLPLSRYLCSCLSFSC